MNQNYARYVTRFHFRFRLIDSMDNLEEFFINSASGEFLNIDTITEIIEHHPQLSRFDLNVCKDDDRKTLENQLYNEWDVSNTSGISFKKKHIDHLQMHV